MSKTNKAMEQAIFVMADENETSMSHYNAIEVWHAYILGNEKWLFAMLDDGVMCEDYFEVTYSKAKDAFFVDHYTKKSNHEFAY